MSEDKYDKIIDLAKRRGYLWSSFEVYGGIAGFVDYGPLGAILKNNVIETWRKHYIVKEEFYEIDSPTVTPYEVLKASGHVDNFTDPMIELNDGLIDVAIAIFTVSGIFISITTLIIQHISDKRGTVIMKLFLEDEVFLKFLAVILYLSIILLLSAIMKVFNVYLVLVVIFGILLSVCTFLSYIKKVCEIVNPSESICYVLEKLSKEELSKDNWKNKIIRKIKNLTYMEKLKNLLKKEIKTNNNGNNGTNGKSKDKKKLEKLEEGKKLQEKILNRLREHTDQKKG